MTRSGRPGKAGKRTGWRVGCRGGERARAGLQGRYYGSQMFEACRRVNCFHGERIDATIRNEDQRGATRILSIYRLVGGGRAARTRVEFSGLHAPSKRQAATNQKSGCRRAVRARSVTAIYCHLTAIGCGPRRQSNCLVLGNSRSENLWTRQLRCTCRLALGAGSAARVRGDLAVVAAAGAGSALGPGPNGICASRAGRALGHALGANRDGGSSLVLIARSPISRRKCRRRGLFVEITRGRELDWVALGIRGRGAEAYRL